MRHRIFFIAIFVLTGITVTAQSKQKAEKEFVRQLNSILRNSRQQHWSDEGIISTDSAFAVNEAGILSSTIRYLKDTGYYKVRMEVPVEKIQSTFWDLYIGLECDSNAVQVFKTDYNSDKLIFTERRDLFHIGILKEGNGGAEQNKLQKALDKLLISRSRKEGVKEILKNKGSY